MGIFSENVRKYFEHGLVTIPCRDKRPLLGKEWQRFCEEKPTEETIDKWETSYKDVNQLGLALGRSTLLSGLDFDYEYSPKCTVSESEFKRDRKLVERQLLAILPPTPCIKTGRKGWTRMYRSHGDLDNAQCDRNGLRLFDFLARNKQTIIPPSRYSDDGDLVYRWLGAPIEDCLDDIPFITQGVVEELKLVLGDKIHSSDNSRHGKLFLWIVRQTVLERDPSVIVRKLVEYDRLINPVPYLSDKKHWPKDDPLVNGLAWVKRIVKWKESKPKKEEYEFLSVVKNSREIYFQFFEQGLGVHKKDLLSDRLMAQVCVDTKHDTKTAKWAPVFNMVPKLRSDAISSGLNRAFVEDHLSAYQDSIKPELLLDIKEWDGVDRIDQILRLVPAVNIVPLVGKEEEIGHDYETGHRIYCDIVKDIGAGIFRRAFDSMEQNLFTIIRGPQRIGKNTFIEKVFAEPFRYYAAEVNIGIDQAKNYDAVQGRLVCIIGEFDQAHKLQISFLKELITNASFTARRAYERTSDRYELKQTFFSASNFKNVLKDTSGNRRFVIWDMPYINSEYMEHCDSSQLLAQYFTLFKAGYRMSEESKKWLNRFIAAETPDDPLRDAIEDYCQRIKEKFAKSANKWLLGNEVMPIISAVCKDHEVPVGRFKAELTRQNLKVRSNGVRYGNTAHSSHEIVQLD